MMKEVASMLKKIIKPFQSKGAILVAFLLLIVLATGVSWYFYSKYRTSQDLLKSPSVMAGSEVQSLVTTVGKLIELPAEEPTVATVSDASKLKGQQFFAHAQNGDKVLIFPKAKRAILYRPSVNKIIEVGPVNIGPSGIPQADTSLKSPSLAVAMTLKIALYNGTTIPGLTKSVEKKLIDAHQPFTVVAKENAAKDSYTQTIVVDLSGSHAAEASKLAKAVNGKVGVFPDGENKPKDALLLVILGSDYK